MQLVGELTAKNGSVRAHSISQGLWIEHFLRQDLKQNLREYVTKPIKTGLICEDM